MSAQDRTGGKRRGRLRNGARAMLVGAGLVIAGIVTGRTPLILTGVLVTVVGWWLALGTAIRRPRRRRRAGPERPG